MLFFITLKVEIYCCLVDHIMAADRDLRSSKLKEINWVAKESIVVVSSLQMITQRLLS